MNTLYLSYIYERYKSLKESEKEFDNYDLSKIFEYYTALKLTKLYEKQFYEYNDIDPNFKELKNMSKNDTGIDLCDLENSIVQCKLRKNNLSWTECSTFFSSVLERENNILSVKWQNLIISRNSDSTLSSNLKNKNSLFTDIQFQKEEMINFCEDLLINFKPEQPEIENFILRDYQNEAITLIKKSKNVIISLPTGCGKNSIIIFSIDEDKKELMLVPRIILMDQLKNEIITKRPELKKNIQCIGDGKNIFNNEKLITICVYNSVHIVKDEIFDKIYIDEAHHINKPDIYKNEDDENIKDDDDEELKNEENYMNIIKGFKVQENNVYLSATIDKTKDFEYFNKDIREMINLKYLCDYVINVPIFTNDPSNKNVCDYLIKNHRNVIIYCNSCEEGQKINVLMNGIQNGICHYIDCFTKKKKRNEILNKYKNGEIVFLVNVRILVEGFDAPITKGVCFLHLPNDKTTLIQIIGRALRLHKDKTIANIILPFNNNDDEKMISKFLNIMACNDSRIRESYKNKKLGGYVNILKVEEENNEVDLKYEAIFDSLGLCLNGKEIWHKKFEELKLHLDTHKKKPTKITNLRCHEWFIHQKQNFKNKVKIMAYDENVYNEWKNFIESDKYSHYFDNTTKIWFKKFNEFKLFLDENKKLPIDNIALRNWHSHQVDNYKTNMYNMKIKIINDTWTEFLNDENYNKYFITTEEKWLRNFRLVKEYYDIHKTLPNDKLRVWTYTQNTNLKTNKDAMGNEKLKKIWTDFLNETESKKRINNFNEDLNLLKQYIDENEKLPDDDNKNLQNYIRRQKNAFNKDKLSDENKNLWIEFIEEYKIYFMSAQDIWTENLNNLKNFIKENNKTPTKTTNEKLCTWFEHQKKNFKKNGVNNEFYKNEWNNFIKEFNI
jgi:superfamily II DNA or RNA helicase